MRRSTASCGISMSCPPEETFPLGRPAPGRPIMDRPDLLQRHEPARYHAVEKGEETVDLRLGIDELDHHRLARARIDAELRADIARPAESLASRPPGRTGHPRLP